MKSIKEKANEYAKDYLFSTLPQRAPNIHFEAGANYVLEQFNRLILAAFRNNTKSIPVWRLIYIIKQLKSNQ